MNNDIRCNAGDVLVRVEEMLNNYPSGGRGYSINKVYDKLSIFDWWKDNLSYGNLKDMKMFLEEAIKLGYEGYVCFKVGASGCANGMWAHKEESTTGYSPDGECLYRSFTPDYTYWSFKANDGCFYPSEDKFDSLKTVNDLEKAIIDYRVGKEIE